MYLTAAKPRETSPEDVINALIHSNVPLNGAYDSKTKQPNLDVKLEHYGKIPLFKVKPHSGETFYIDLTSIQEPVREQHWNRQPQYLAQHYIIEDNNDVTVLLQKNANYQRLPGIERMLVIISPN